MTADVYLDLRGRALGLDQATFDLPLRGRVYGAVMETGFEDAWSYTLVCLSDGATSLYFSHGGGIIGGGEHERVAAATLRFLDVVSGALNEFWPDSGYDLPAEGHVILRALTPSGRLRVNGTEDDLGEGRHPQSSVFYAAHEVITELRLLEEGA